MAKDTDFILSKLPVEALAEMPNFKQENTFKSYITDCYTKMEKLTIADAETPTKKRKSLASFTPTKSKYPQLLCKNCCRNVRRDSKAGKKKQPACFILHNGESCEICIQDNNSC